MSRRGLRAAALAAATAWVAGAGAADLPEVTVTLDPAEVYPGSPARLRVDVIAPPSLEVDVDALAAAMGGLEGGSPRPMVEETLEDGRALRRLETVLRPFDLGDGEGRRASLAWGGEYAAELWLPAPDVVPVPRRQGDREGQLRAAKTVVEAPGEGAPAWLWVLLALAGVALAVVLHRRRRPAAPAASSPPEDPFARAMRLLAELEARGDDGDPRSFHYRLSEILREYLASRFGISALAETTDEVLAELSAVGVDPTHRTRAEELLQRLDRVKFGPDHAPADASASNLRCSVELVETTRPPPPSEDASAEDAGGGEPA